MSDAIYLTTRRSTHQMSRRQRILAIVFITSFAFDFKGSSGGSTIQLIMAGLNTAAFLLLAASYSIVLPRHGLGKFVLWGWLIFLVTGTLGAVVNDTPAGHYFRISYTFILFLEGFLVAWWTTRDSRNAGVVVSAMMTTAIISLFFTFVWGFYFTGQSAELIRYQILSPLIPLLFVVASYDLFFARRRQMRSIMLLAITLGVMVLSITRTEILVIGFVAGLILSVVFLKGKRFGILPRPIIRVVTWGWIIVGIGLAVAALFNFDVLGRWMNRSLGVGHDVTFWTRVAAVVGQYQNLTVTHLGWLVGMGFGSSYPWPVSEFPWILRYLGNGAGHPVWFPGEFMWMPFLYYGGFIIGSIAAIVLLRGALFAYRTLARLMGAKSWKDPRTRPLWVGVLGYFAFIGMGFTANPFLLRLAALFMGLCLGLVIAQGQLFKGNNTMS